MIKKSKEKEAKQVLDSVMQSNVRAIKRIEQSAHDARTRADKVADAIAGFCGSSAFLYVHCIWFVGWLSWNGLRVIPSHLQFDPAPFATLGLVVVLESIFLSTFILISQNRQQRIAEQRNHLDLQINMLAEQENSEMLAMMKKVMEHLGIDRDTGASDALQGPTDHERLVEHIQEHIQVSDDPPSIV